MAHAAHSDDPRPAGAGRPAIPVRVPKMAEIVAEHIRRDIVTGVLKEGEMLPAAAVLMERYGVSKPTVREALRILESETLIDVRRGAAGARIRVPSEATATRVVGTLLQLQDTTLADVAQARMAFEPWLAGLLARTRTEADVAQLRDALQASRDVQDHAIAFTERGSAFHDLVVRLARNHTLALVSRMLDAIVARHTITENPASASPSLRAQVMEEHERLVELIAAGRDAEAEALWREHIRMSAEQLLGASAPDTPIDLYMLQTQPGLRLEF